MKRAKFNEITFTFQHPSKPFTEINNMIQSHDQVYPKRSNYYILQALFFKQEEHPLK